MTFGSENMPVFLGLGNPLLDLSISVDNQDIHNTYGLKVNDAILAEDRHMEIYNDLLKDKSVKFVPGGSTLNTIRMIQWLNETPETAAFFGCVGKDEAAKKLKQECDNLCLKTYFTSNDSLSTGKCAVVIHGHERSLITHLGAAQAFKNIDMNDEMLAIVNNALVYYIAGYFLTSCPEAIQRIAEVSGRSHTKLFAFNLSAPFLSTFFKDEIDKVLPYVDILFGNREEFMAFCKSHAGEVGESVQDLCNYFCKMKRPENMVDKTRIVIMTDGCADIICQVGDEILSFPVPEIDQSMIVDSNGAGDAFVAGFLYEYQKCKCIKSSLKTATKTAHYILMKSGFELDKNLRTNL